ncbi:MAG: 4-carboxymuconolactone decarboxylase [Myxococcales bacterium]
MAKTPELFDEGLEIRKEVLGKAYVDSALRTATSFNEDFQKLVTQLAWGAVWSRPGLPRKTRSMLTIAMLAALGQHDELRLHVRATRNTGVTQDEVKEVLLQVAVYAGIPAANSAFQHARRAYQELEEDEEAP